jgi:hypothetical protein
MSAESHVHDENGEVDAEVEAEAEPLNRAERRAKGKGKTLPAAAAKIVPGKTNNSHGPRQYSHRRSG